MNADDVARYLRDNPDFLAQHGELFTRLTVPHPQHGGQAISLAERQLHALRDKIRLLVGIDRDGRVTGVRVVSHKETPGLGDYIDIGKSDWIKGFDGQSLERPDAWRVRKDGGQFDYMAGATITPRAVVAAVARTLAFFHDYRAELAGSTR